MQVGRRNCRDYFAFADTRPESTHLVVGKGRSRLDLAAVLKKRVQPAFAKVGIIGVGWHAFRHTVGTKLAEMGEHQLTTRDYLRHTDSTPSEFSPSAANKHASPV
jgi:integrase